MANPLVYCYLEKQPCKMFSSLPEVVLELRVSTKWSGMYFVYI